MFGKLWRYEDTEISGISDNSQRIMPGEVFICRRGNTHDGCDYINDALKRGAAAIVSHRAVCAPIPVIPAGDILSYTAALLKRFYLPKRHFSLIGVTGTNGKTTVTHIIKDILEHNGKRVALCGTNGIYISGEKRALYTSAPTTPGICELWRIFAAAEHEAADYVVMEVSSHALSEDRVLGCDFDVGVFTNLTRDHLDFHKTMNEYAAAKKKLFTISKSAVINIDDTLGAKIFSDFDKQKLSVGFGDADISVSALSSNGGGSVFNLQYLEQSAQGSLCLPGRFNVSNMLLAAGACILSGLELEAVADGLSHIKPVRGRCERIDTNRGYDVIIDYAHTPDGLEKLIHTAKGITRARVICVFGCGGNRDKTKRPLMGEIAGRLSDYTIITSDNPRFENPFSIISDIYEGINKTNGEYCIIPDRAMAIRHALSLARTGDIVLLAGKGQETYQLTENKKYHFDEREIVWKYLQKG